MDLFQQLDKGYLVSPLSKKRLSLSDDGEWLVTGDGAEKYELINKKVPILLADPSWVKEYVGSSQNNSLDDSPEFTVQSANFWTRFKAGLLQGHKSPAFVKAFTDFFDAQKGDSLCLSIGGGPGRSHPKLVNLNIGPFQNVEIVADAHFLPYASESVDAIFLGAVLEHLSDPAVAVKEMYRILKKEGMLFSDTPFLQGYHGYPHHYQNYTVTGHRFIFESINFEILGSGVSVGPVFTLVHLSLMFVRNFFPSFLRWSSNKLVTIMGALVLPFDKYLINSDKAYLLASGTYVIAKKNDIK